MAIYKDIVKKLVEAGHLDLACAIGKLDEDTFSLLSKLNDQLGLPFLEKNVLRTKVPITSIIPSRHTLQQLQKIATSNLGAWLKAVSNPNEVWCCVTHIDPGH